MINYIISVFKLPFEFSKKDSEVNISKFLLFSFLPGAIISWKYFFKIKYLPELEVQSILLLLSTTAIITWLLLLSVPYCFIFPGILWKYFIAKDKLLNIFFSKRRLKSILKKRKIFLDYLPCSGSHYFVYTWIGNACLFVFLVRPYSLYGILSLFFYLLLFLNTIYGEQKFNLLSWNNIWKSTWVSIKIWFYSLYSFLVYEIFWLLATASYLNPQKVSMKCYNNNEIIGYFIGIFIIFMFLNLLAIRDKSSHSENSYFISLLVILFSIIYLSSLDAVSDLVIRTYGWGDIEHATIMVDQKGCQTIEKMGIDSRNKCLKQDSVYRFNEVHILSLVGKNYYLRFPGYYPQGQLDPVTFTLPSSNIISWSRQNIELELPANHKRTKFCNS
jgi:hypothetical protein